MKKVKTTCVYCGTGCQVWLKIDNNGKVVDTKPVRDAFNPGHGKLCIKGWALHEFINSPDRLTDPMIRKDGNLVKVSWDEAIECVALKFKSIIKENPGNNRVLGFFSSAKCTNEENFVMQKFARAVCHTNSVDHCARLCHSSTVVGLGAAFGSGAMTNSIDEIKDADVLFIIGSNTLEAHPLIGTQLFYALKKGAKLIVADPRMISISELAVESGGIAINHKPGTDVALLNGIMNVIINENLQDQDFIDKNCENYSIFRDEIMKMSPEKTSEITGVPKQKIIESARIIGKAKTVSVLYSMGITQHTTGVDNVKSIANLQMLCGNIGKWATGVNPLRGQQNVQGACDMGALPNVFPGYQKVTDPEIREKFAKAWGIKTEEMDDQIGYTLIEMINEAYNGNIKAIWVMGENPMVSDPDINHVREALKKIFLVVQDIFMTPTAQLADVILPGASFAETDGTFTNTERRIQMVRRAIEPVGNAKYDWKIVGLVAKRMGYDGLTYSHVIEINREITQHTPIYGGITWDRLLSDEKGLQWPCPDTSHPGTVFLHKDGKFTRGKGLFHAVEFKEPAEIPDEEYPFILSTGRILWHFHTGTMTRRSPTLNERIPEGYVEINGLDAKALNIKDGEMVEVSSRRGEIKIKCKVTPRVMKGMIFIPFHFEEAAANVLTNPALDPVAKIPELKTCAVNVKKI